jgi:4-alpha-glucanotransferase
MAAGRPSDLPVVPRRAGLLLHVTSLPGPYGIGDIGPAAEAFADWLAAAGISVWQMLPIGPVGYGDSPYSSPSSFAIEPTFLALEPLVAQGLLAKADLKVPAKDARRLATGDCDFAANRAFRMARYAKAAAAFAAQNGARSKDYRAFTARAAWLPAWIDFVAGGDEATRAMHAWIQYELDRQWAGLRSYCGKRGIVNKCLCFRVFKDVSVFIGCLARVNWHDRKSSHCATGGNFGIFQSVAHQNTNCNTTF